MPQGIILVDEPEDGDHEEQEEKSDMEVSAGAQITGWKGGWLPSKIKWWEGKVHVLLHPNSFAQLHIHTHISC